MVTQAEAAKEILARRAARNSLLDYTCYTKPDFLVGEHHKKIADALERVERGEIDRLMIFAPPRHTKSELASRRFPSWYLGRHPDRQLICSTYSGDFALDFGREVRGIVNSQEYKNVFPGVGLAEDSRAANRWHTTQGGVSVYVGVGGPITGRGAHCFVAGTKVHTNQGLINIEQLQHVASSVKILSYGQGQLQYKELQAFSRRAGVGIYRVTTTGGRVVEATGDHPFYVDGRYIEAAKLTAGDSLMCAMPEGVHKASIRDGEAHQARPRGHLLFSGVLEGASCSKEYAQMRSLREAGREENAEVLRRLSAAQKENATNVSTDSDNMPHVQCVIHGGMAWQIVWKVRKVLLETLFGAWSLAAYVGGWKPEIQGRGNTGTQAAAFGASIQEDEATCFGSRWSCLRSMLKRGNKVRGSSFGQLADEQCSIKPSDVVREVPQQMARGEGWEAFSDTVALVERVREEATVYDIQVADNHNFFADGVLVHNCALIDDPFKNREEADSALRRETVWKWYTSTLRTRLMPGGAIILVLTRWHDDDLAGRLLASQGNQWTVVELQAIANEGTDKEVALWPEWYGLDDLKRIRSDVGARDWSALYQQRPQPETGTYFERDWFRWYENTPKHLNIYICSDYAVTGNGGDYTEHGVFGIDPEGNIYLLDWWSGQTTADVWIDALLDLVKQYKPMAVFGETGVIRKAVEPYITRRSRELKVYARFEWITRTGDKSAMARGYQARAASGKVYLPTDKPWAQEVLAQNLAFPVGRNDDKVDVQALLGMALDMAHPAIVSGEQKTKKRRDIYAMHDDDDDNGGGSWRTV